MYFGNSHSMTVHYPTCGHVNRISDINLAGFDYINDAKKEGYRICKCCDPMVRRVNLQESEMIGYCRKRAISYEVVNGSLIVDTPFSQWKAYIGTKGGYDLYHRNTRGRITDYHLQKEGMRNPMEILKYIDHHDNFRLANPLPQEKKKKVPPRKGTKRYRAEMRKAERAKRRYEIKNVLDLIDSLAMA